jgi:D-alanyl-lipoteichoic acid acyltransferase DltB (MBOAT superfamily)
MEGDSYNLWARLQDLFTRLKVEELDPSQVQFHFAIAQYWLFFALAYLGFALVYRQKLLRSAYLTLVSLFFYWKVGAPFLWILIFSTFIDYGLGWAVFKDPKKWRKQLWVATSMVINLGMLAYFKYFKFIAANWNSMVAERDLPDWMYIQNADKNALGMLLNGQFGADIFLENLPMVVGISFYTFQTMSYTIDIYRGHIKPLRSIVDFGFFVTFFPQLVAGPIVRASEFVPQIHKKFSLTKEEFGWSVYMILKGLVKKMVFADFIAAYFLDDVFKNPSEFSGMAILIAVFGYTLQIYGDFAGYTDIAIGAAKLMGFDLPTNFNSPYKAKHCGEFWQRWHMSLSSWLKDYLYIPLGGNKKMTAGSYIVTGLIVFGVLYAIDNMLVTYISLATLIAVGLLSWNYPGFYKNIVRNINILLTMLLGGLWHGASWQFVIWGGLNGLGVLVTKYWNRMKPSAKMLFALVVGGLFALIQVSSRQEIWWVAVGWAVVVAAIQLGKVLYALAGGKERTTWYLNAAWAMVHTMTFISFTRIYFRGETMDKINALYHQLLHDFRFDFSDTWLYASSKTTGFVEYKWAVFMVIAAGFLVHWVPTVLKKRLERQFVRIPIPVQLTVAVVTVVLCYQAYSADAPAFIYFQF